MSWPRVAVAVAGGRHDGARLYGTRLAEARRRAGGRTDVIDVAGLDAGGADAVDVVHLHLSDAVLRTARSATGALVAGCRSVGIALVVTVHDVPQPPEGAERFERRRRDVVEVVRGAAAVVVSSHHESELAQRLGFAAHVVFHPAFPPLGCSGVADRPPAAGDGQPTVGVLGHVHPGKGIVGVLGPAARNDARLVLIGDAPPHHSDHLDEIAAAAERVGVPLEVTGHVHEDELATHLALVDVPVVPHAHVSASGSLLTWVAHGRRPLASNTGFAIELSGRAPSTVELVTADAWTGSIARAIAEPVSTRHDGIDNELGVDRAVTEYERVYQRVLASSTGPLP